MYHERDYDALTNVMQEHCVITSVRTLAERLVEAREEADLTQEQLAAKAGVSQGTIANAESGTRKLPREYAAIAMACGVSPEWLKSEKGPKHSINYTLTGESGSYSREELSNIRPAEPRKKVPRISWVQAGSLSEVQDFYQPGEAETWDDVFVNVGRHAFSLSVIGDSMTNPYPGDVDTFPEGTVLIVDPDASAQANSYVIAKDVSTQQATFKKLVHDGGRWFLKPLNPAYPTIEIDDPAMRVIGKVVESFSRRKLP